MSFIRIMLLATTIAASAAPAVAQTVAPTRVVAFGDSYADNGNVFRLSGTAPPFVYATGRFSGGTNFIDALERLFNAPQVNFGIGGALAGPGNTGTNNISSPALPGFQFEVASFLAGGGGAFPNVAPRFTRDDLLAISIGGNDARLYELTPGSTVAGAIPRAAVSVADATRGLDLLFNAGARNIAFLAGNVGDLPEVRGTPVAAVGSAFSQAFNAGIQAPLARYAADGALVHYLDLQIVGDRIRANPSAYGLVSAGACPVACVGNPALQDQFLFYVDQVHLTSAGFEIVGRYFQRMIEAPGRLAAMSDLGLSSAKSFTRTMEGRNELAGAGNAERPLGIYLLGVTDRHDVANSATSLAYDYDATGIAGGVEYNPGGVFAGVALSYTRPRADFSRADARVKGDAYHVGVYGGFEAAGVSLSATAGYGKSDFDGTRDGVIDPISSSTDGTSYSLSGEASYGFALSERVSVGPVVNLAYARARIDGYTESGDAALTLAVERHRAESLVGAAGVELKGDIDANGLAIRPYLQATLAKQFMGDGEVLRFAATAAPTIVNQFRVGETSEDVYGQVELGASLALGASVSAELQGVASVEKPGGNDYGGYAGLKLRF